MRSSWKRPKAADVAPLDFGGEPVVLAWMPAASLYLRDPDGNMLEFLSMLPNSPQPELGIVGCESLEPNSRIGSSRMGHSPATLSRTRSVDQRTLTLASSANKTGIRQFWLARHTGTPANLPRQRLRIDEHSAHGPDYFQS
jgi:hypothetical protein